MTILDSDGKSSSVNGDNDQSIGKCLYLAYSLSATFADVRIRKPPVLYSLNSCKD